MSVIQNFDLNIGNIFDGFTSFYWITHKIIFSPQDQ